MRIGINCGHTVSGTKGCGAVGYMDESVENRKLGKALMVLLKNGGHAVYDCTDDYADSVSANLNKIVKMANKQPLDLFVSIHFNAGKGIGTEVYTYGQRVFKEAENVCEAMAGLGFNNRGIKDGSHLCVVNSTDAKAMLVEVCFVDSDDAEKYKSLGVEKVAQALYTAITGQRYLAVTEYTKSNDIIWELETRGVLQNKALWLQRCEEDSNIYWFCRKLCHYIRTKQRVEHEQNEYTDIHDIVWDLQHRGILSQAAMWENMMNENKDVYWLLRKGLHWCRTH